ncbi:MAG: fimbrial protein pilin [Candidatus Saccharibacteria bacterium]|nr:fimbrial protein pilin [Candidatus Saccharibacteria bacterium]
MSSLKKVTQKGFTIVELLIVIVVIGILAGLVITTYNGIQQNARNKERVTDAKALKGQLEAYYAQNVKYPTLAQLNTDPTETSGFIRTNMKGLDVEALRDPKAAAGTYVLIGTADADSYGYTATPTGCDNTATDCTGYTLSYREEGKTDNTTVQGSN